ncbi:hypothetical protein ACH5RR_025794 [Cinchona calisaya]|uniref:Uncharacterized protein n=1 Tax=Cinchona calisaya TaxID=153742 RepID=A0ABD2Z4P3_9GENT
MAEMRLTAARKMEEAAKAVEAIALAERNTLLDAKDSPEIFLHKPGGIILSIEEFNSLTHKAQQAEELCKTKFVDTNTLCQTDQANQSEVTILKKLEIHEDGEHMLELIKVVPFGLVRSWIT